MVAGTEKGDAMAGGPHEDGCFCGRTRYRGSEEPTRSAVCHRVSCRRTSGAPSVAWLTFPYRGLSFVSGEPADFRSSDGVSRTFCGGCGTSLTYRYDGDPDHIDVTWDVADGLPRFERGGPSD